MKEKKGNTGGTAPTDTFGRLLAEAVPFVPYALKIDGIHDFPVEAVPVLCPGYEKDVPLCFINSHVKSCDEKDKDLLNIRFINRRQTLWVALKALNPKGELPMPRAINFHVTDTLAIGELRCEDGTVLPIFGAIVMLTTQIDLERRIGVEDGKEEGRDLTNRELLAGIEVAVNKSNSEKDELRRQHEQVRRLVDECGYSADTFICGLTERLSMSEMSLLFKLIAKNGGKCRTYQEIGDEEGCTRQNILAKRKKLEKREPSIRGYIDRVRDGEKLRLFSEMSPSQRRSKGVDECYH